jgi:hypothetical protein
MHTHIDYRSILCHSEQRQARDDWNEAGSRGVIFSKQSVGQHIVAESWRSVKPNQQPRKKG